MDQYGEAIYQFDDPDNLVDLIENSVEKFANNKLFGVKNSGGELDWITYKEIGERIDNLRAGLKTLDIKKGDSIGFIGNNRPEWAISAFATYGLVAKFIPMYESELESVQEYIIKDSKVKFLIVSNMEVYSKTKKLIKKVESLKKIFVIETDDKKISMAALEEKGALKPVASKKPKHTDLSTLIYTSGTTGDPKGVLLTHGNFTSNYQAGQTTFPELNEESRSISILPWAHSYGQTAELYNWIAIGGSLGFMEDVTTLANDLMLIKPSFIIAVPRVFNKIFDGVKAKMKEEGGAKEFLFNAALNAVTKKRELAKIGKSSILTNIKFSILDSLVFSKIRARFGGNLEMALTASATMNIEVGQFFFDIGIPVYDAYGLSETSPAITMNAPGDYKLGSVGKPLSKIKVVIDKSVVEDGAIDGEIVVYGPNVMKGYNNKPAETKKVIMKDKGFRTGDRGRLDNDGFLYITGRIKEQFKLENGKYVFPTALEEDIRLLPNIANAMVYGDGRRNTIALIIPDFEVLGKYASKNKIDGDPEALINNKDITAMIEKEIQDSLGNKYGGYEIPKSFIFLHEDFTLENGMLTQTMKLKRRVVVKKFMKQIDALYDR